MSAKSKDRDPAERFLSKRQGGVLIKSPRIYYARKRLKLVSQLLRRLKKGAEIRRHFGVSKSVYEKYTDWEMRIYEHGSRITFNRGRMDRVSFKEIRAYYLAPIIEHIEALHRADPSRPVEVLEVGCGNGTNLMILKGALGDAVRLRGIDVSPERIKLGYEYWGDAVEGVEMQVDSATVLETQADGSADLVYSVHCLEQIPYAVDACIESIERVTRSKAVFVEPTWELANTTQRLYTLFGDQLRTLIPTLEGSGLEIVSSTKAELLAHPLNQTGIVVARLPRATATRADRRRRPSPESAG